MRIALAAIFKNECEYILEWIAYHRNVIGITDFIIADNASDDGSTQLLQALDQAGIIKRIFFPRESENTGPQVPAYNHIIKHYGNEYDYFLFIDADEFLVNESGKSLPSLIQEFSHNESFGGIALNWRNFGSSGNTYSQPGLVIERFYRAAVKSEPVHRHVKSLVASTAIEHMHIHNADLKPGFYFYNELGNKSYFLSRPSEKTALPDGKSAPFSSEIHNSFLYVAHFAVKSKKEHFLKKASRGSAGGMASREKGRQYFIGHDLNQEICLDLAKHTTAVYSEMLLLKNILKEKTPYYSFCRTNLDNHFDYIHGWAGSDFEGELQLCILLDEKKELVLPLNTKRKDVYEKKFSRHEICGFKYPWKEIGGYKQSIRLWIKGSNHVIFEANIQ